MAIDQDTVTVRRATSADSEMLLAWRNDPVTRQMFVNQEAVGAEEHARWMRDTLQRGDRLLVIGQCADSVPLGVVRFDIDSHAQRAEVSITVAPTMRGKGFAARLLGAAIDYLRCQSSGSKDSMTLTARIRKVNAASIACFERVGFKTSNEDVDYVYLVRG